MESGEGGVHFGAGAPPSFVPEISTKKALGGVAAGEDAMVRGEAPEASALGLP
jgi:hypothetical protein